MSEAYSLIRPDAQTSAVVYASPHSGRHYPWSFLRKSVLDELTIRSSEDAFIDLLIEHGAACGSPVLCAAMPRAYLDLNRSADELDPALIEGVRMSSHNPRISSGLGVIPRVVSNGRAIYRGKIKLAEANHRLSTYWRPYHDTLQQLLDHTRSRFGQAVLVDWHSMPHEAVEAVTQANKMRPDVVIGDRFGASASGEIVERIETALLEAGLKVARNTPFAGAYITQHYGRPSRRQHALQIEIDRSLYMNEDLVRPNGNFGAFQTLMNGLLAEISDIGRTSLPMAAE